MKRKQLIGTEPVKAIVVEAPHAKFKGDWEAWYVYRIAGRIVGVSHTRAKAMIHADLVRSSDPDVHYQREERLVYQSGATRFVQRKEISSVESYDGVLKSFEGNALTGPIPLRVRGISAGQALRIDTLRADERNSLELAWDTTSRGPFSVDQSLRRSPLAVGETRWLRTLTPSLQSVGLISMRCIGEASITMLDGHAETLREVEVQVMDSERLLDEYVAWIDLQGRIKKTLRPAMMLESIYTDASTARQLFDRGDDEIRIRVTGTIESDRIPRSVTYQIRSIQSADTKEPTDNQQYESIIGPAVSQYTQAAADHLTIWVSEHDAPPNGFADYQSSPTDDDTAETPVFDFRQSAIEKIAHPQGDFSARQLVAELSRVTRDAIGLSIQESISRASVILRNGRGGELDHSILLTALLRANDVPARVVLGLKLVDGENQRDDKQVTMRMGNWVIVFVDGQWVAVDPLSPTGQEKWRLTLAICEGSASVADQLDDLFLELANSRITIQDVRYESGDGGQ